MREEKYKELDFDDMRFKYSEDDYEMFCDRCNTGFNELRPQKYTSYDEDGNIVNEEWIIICPVCNSILEG